MQADTQCDPFGCAMCCDSPQKFHETCGSSERLRVHSVDGMAAYIAWCLTNLTEESMEEVVGKTYDLKNAYKQYGVCAEGRETLRLAVWNPEEREQ